MTPASSPTQQFADLITVRSSRKGRHLPWSPINLLKSLSPIASKPNLANASTKRERKNSKAAIHYLQIRHLRGQTNLSDAPKPPKSHSSTQAAHLGDRISFPTLFPALT